MGGMFAFMGSQYRLEVDGDEYSTRFLFCYKSLEIQARVFVVLETARVHLRSRTVCIRHKRSVRHRKMVVENEFLSLEKQFRHERDDPS